MQSPFDGDRNSRRVESGSYAIAQTNA